MTEQHQTLELGPRHPATPFLLRIALTTLVGAIAEAALPDSRYKSIIIVGSILVAAILLYLDARRDASVRLDIDAKARRLKLQRQFILGRTRNDFAFEDIADLEINWSEAPASVEAKFETPDVNSIVLIAKDGTRHVVLAPASLRSGDNVRIRDFENAFRRTVKS